MKIKKFIVYIMAAVFAAAVQPAVYAEPGNDAIIVVPWYSDEDSETEPTEASGGEDERSEPLSENPDPAESSASDSTADTTELPEESSVNDPFTFEEPDESSDSSDTSDSPDISEETTTEEPQISLDTAPPTEDTTAEPPTETEPPVTETTTEALTETEESTPAATETPPSETEPPVETTTEERENTTSPMILPPEGGNGAGPVEGDPDSFITTILLIAGAIVLFVLILTVPPIFRKIRKNIIYKYD